MGRGWRTRHTAFPLYANLPPARIQSPISSSSLSQDKNTAPAKQSRERLLYGTKKSKIGQTYLSISTHVYLISPPRWRAGTWMERLESLFSNKRTEVKVRRGGAGSNRMACSSSHRTLCLRMTPETCVETRTWCLRRSRLRRFLLVVGILNLLSLVVSVGRYIRVVFLGL